MPRITISQIGGSLSNPLNNNGMNNILLQPGQGDGGLGQDVTMKISDLKEVLKEIIDPKIKNTEDHQEKILNAEKFFKEYATDLNALYGALKNNTEGAITKDPLTGKEYPTGPQLAKDLLSRIEKMKETVSLNKVFNMARFSAAKKNRAREEKDKKKTRGNPFRVLMGQVGKMLDHGISKKDIVRYIAKKNMWNEETIGKAVDVVSDYSKKTRSKEKKFQEKKSNVNEASVRLSAIDATTSIYDVAPDFTKRSTAEMMARASWLNDLLNYNEKTPQGDMRKAANKDGVSAELKKIREALKARGFETNELP
jgi:hypothetical protein